MLGAAYAACALAPLCAAALSRGADLAWIDPATIRFYKVSDAVPRNFLYRAGVLAAGLLLLGLDAFPARWREWIRAQNPAELEAGFLAAVAAWAYALFSGGFSAPVRELAFFLGLLLAVRLLSRGKPEALPAASRALLAALTCAAALSALIFAFGEPAHVFACGLLLFHPWIEKRLGLRRGLARRHTPAVVLAVLFGVFWVTIPPSAFRFPLDLSRLPPDLLTFYEGHLNIFALGPALQLRAHGGWSGVQLLYGWAAPLLMVGLNRAFGCPIGIGTYLKLSFALKYAFVCCALIAYYLYSGRRLLPSALFSLWALSWNNSASPALEANHSAVRFIGVPFFFLVLWFVRRRPFRILFAAAVPALWLCALINPETALALFAALLVYAWFRWRDDGLPARLRRTFALVAAVAPAALLYRSGLMSLLATGFGGSEFASSPAPYAVILLALIVWAAVAASPDARSPKNAFRAAAAAFLLIWGAYYVNRPLPSNLDVHLYVFAFFALDIVRAAAFKAPSVPRRIGLLMLVAVAAPLLTGALTASEGDLLWQFRRPQSIFHPAAPGRVASGVQVSAAFSAELSAAREAWRKYSRPGEPCLLLVSHPVFLAEAACVPAFPFADPFPAFLRADDPRELGAIRSSPARTLFIEPDRDLADDDRRDYFDRLRAGISGEFRLRANTPHLEIWERRAR